ncbi:hypothetical protein [Pseudobacter ginsenosidimutans]|uniref:Uncharacterized protein n=1 Tax=Pseudobacter ginsenosidimutans TaxID=661488 RepID=A0A4V2F276_9BACT|nr:hypothetical protein [Pseudobacter ginsenosidimutans]QEC44817.1 hypothetical protein FSB84_25210 [Pseudobacter ginsenosidimutans]RZS76307.1 hypothetical protein EV199_2188 [Pseudobacter ginsenosidimutans]
MSISGNNGLNKTRLSIPKEVTAGLIDKLGSSMTAALEGVVDLQIPSEVFYRGFGVIPSLFLFVFTWIRTCRGTLIIDIDPNNKQGLADFIESNYGYVIVITVWKDTKIVAKDGTDLKPLLREHTNNMRKRIDFLQDLPNFEIVIPNFDHYPVDKGLSHWFYINNYSFASVPSELDNTTYRIFEKISSIYRSRITNAVSDLLDTTTRIIWELMGNTNEHAIKDHLDQKTLSPNTRGLYIKLHQSSKANFEKNAKEDPALLEYYAKSLIDGDNLVLEISVFDSGPGMVKRYKGSDWAEDAEVYEDVNIIKTCLVRGESSVKGPARMNKGYGLDDVLKLLDQKRGFLKIRTGRVSLFRDLTATPYVESQNTKDIKLYDCNTLSSEDFQDLCWFEGTQITMAYPITK